MTKARNSNKLLSKLGATILPLVGSISMVAVTQAAEQDVYSLEEVMVTAQKRAQSVNDIGVTVSAFSGDEISNLGVETISDLNAIAPNVNVRDSNSGVSTNVTIRGVGLQDFSINNTPTVGMYIDDVFLTSTSLLNDQIYDIGRVEVLKGPQGTLYGRNTTGGLINFISAKPSDEFLAKVSFGVGNYESSTVDFVLNGALTDNLNGRVALHSTKQGEGFYESRVLNRDIGRKDSLAGRVQLAWTPSEDTSVGLKLESASADSEPNPFVHFGTLDPNGFLNAFFGSTPCAPIASGRIDTSACVDSTGYSDNDGDPFTGDWNDIGHGVNSEFQMAILDVTTEFEFGELTSITGFINADRIYTAKPDAGPLTLLQANPDDSIEQFTEELRLTGGNDSVDWIVGAFYSSDKVSSTSLAEVAALFAQINLPINTLGTVKQETKSQAIFVHTDWHLSDDTRLIAGLRYTWEQKDFSATNLAVSPASGAVLFPLTNTAHELSNERQSWRLGLEHDLNSETLLYASVSEGFKSGGFFGGTFSTQNAQYDPYDEEVLIAYETGIKATLFENTMQFNAAAFYYDYSDIQVFTGEDIGGVIFNKLRNIDEAEVLGAEIEIAWRPFQGFNVRSGLGWLDTELGSFNNSVAGGVQTIAAGNQLASAPELSYNLQLSYEFDVTDDLELYSQLGGNFTDEVYKEPFNNEFLKADSFWVFNARIALRDQTDTWSVEAWANNLFDEEYESHIFDNGTGNGGIVYGSPRTFGVTATYRFQ